MQADRLALLARHAAAARVPRPQPHAATSWIDLEDDEEADALLRGLGVAPAETPVVIWAAARCCATRRNAELGRALGLGARGPPPPLCDLVVVGGGPAGLPRRSTAPPRASTRRRSTRWRSGGQASTSARIENYLGFPAGISGSELAERAAIQARKFGARLVVPAEAVGLEREDGHHVVQLSTAATSRPAAR